MKKLLLIIVALIFPFIIKGVLEVYSFGCKYGGGDCIFSPNHIRAIVYASFYFSCFLLVYIFIPIRYKKIKILISIIGFVFILLSLFINLFSPKFSLESYFIRKVQTDKCSSLPHESLIQYCKIYDRLASSDPDVCEEIPIIPKEYEIFLYEDVRMKHMQGLFGNYPIEGFNNYSDIQSSCYWYLVGFMPKNDLDGKKETCDKIPDVNNRKYCYINAGLEPMLPREHLRL